MNKNIQNKLKLKSFRLKNNIKIKIWNGNANYLFFLHIIPKGP